MGHIQKLLYVQVAILALGSGSALANEADSSEEAAYTYSSGVDYISGKFGDVKNTKYFLLPQIGTITYGRWSTEWTIPYMIARGPNNVIPGVGVDDFVTDDEPPTSSSTRTGLGDILGEASYRAYGEAEDFHINLVGKIKFGTASKARGLGTGRNDYEPAVEVVAPVEDFTFSALSGYSFNGSPPGLKLKDTFFAQAKTNYSLTPQTDIGLIASYESGIDPSSPGGGSTQMLSVYVVQELIENWKIMLDSSKGFSPSSLDYGFGMALIHNF